jgi:hypothetical protein
LNGKQDSYPELCLETGATARGEPLAKSGFQYNRSIATARPSTRDDRFDPLPAALSHHFDEVTFMRAPECVALVAILVHTWSRFLTGAMHSGFGKYDIVNLFKVLAAFHELS